MAEMRHVGGGGGGKVIPGTGGDGGSASPAFGGDGGDAGSDGENATNRNFAAGGGGGWGGDGGDGYQNIGGGATRPPGNGGKAVDLNGNTVTWGGSFASAYSTHVLGAVS